MGLKVRSLGISRLLLQKGRIGLARVLVKIYGVEGRRRSYVDRVDAHIISMQPPSGDVSAGS